MTEQERSSPAAQAADEAREVADRGDAQADRLEDQAQRLKREIESARQDWRAKQADPSVPGAVQPETERDSPKPGARPQERE